MGRYTQDQKKQIEELKLFTNLPNNFPAERHNKRPESAGKC